MLFPTQRNAYSSASPSAGCQGVQFMLADMEAAVETARQMVYHAAALIDSGMPCSRAASIAKLTASDNCMKVCTDAVQILGGYGLCREYPVERFFRNAKTYQIVEGTNQIRVWSSDGTSAADEQGGTDGVSEFSL